MRKGAPQERCNAGGLAKGFHAWMIGGEIAG